VARLRGSTVVIEFHEVQDPGEEAIPLLSLYARLFVPLLIRLSQGAVVHTSRAYELLDARYDIQGLDVEIIPLGPYDHYSVSTDEVDDSSGSAPYRILFFGLIRPYKGAEDLVEAFSGLSESEVEGLELIVAGETWEGWTLPARLIESSPYRDRIRFINRYLSDAEVGTLFATTDVLVLPYRRATSSGPLSIAMNCGIPVIVYDVPELREAAISYSGARFVAVNDVQALREAIRQIRHEPVVTHEGPASWQRTRSAYEDLIGRLQASAPSKRARVRRPRHRPVARRSLSGDTSEPCSPHSSTRAPCDSGTSEISGE
jgi:glycosyltransferase involved in cell wall biosynthesis